MQNLEQENSQNIPNAESPEAAAKNREIENTEISQNYEIVGRQGCGGCSVVYDGWRKTDGRHVAIKVLSLPESLAESEAEWTKSRFYREARILMNLHEEHVVECFEYGVFHGAPCVVLEFVEGIQLNDYLKDFGALPFDYAIGIICQVLGALSAAHKLGIIHRDIKPENIMIIQDSEPPVCRLIDFGIASLQEGALGELNKTKLGVVRGTPAYMAPELFSGNVAPSAETDLYAVGLVLCECITGRASFSGASLMQIAFKQAHEEIDIPAMVPMCLANIIRKSCAKSPDERYHDAAVMSKDLQDELPEAMKLRASCEMAYLNSIKEGGKKADAQQNSKKMTFILVGVVAALILIAVIAFFATSGNSSQAPAADSAEAAKPAANAEAEARLLEAEARVKEAEAAKLKAEEDKAKAEAAKAKAEEDHLQAQVRAKEADDARIAAENAQKQAAAAAPAPAPAPKPAAPKKTTSQPSAGTPKTAPAKTGSNSNSNKKGAKKDQSAIPLSIL